MDNPEQYLIQVLRRTQAGLQDSLLPYHGTKMVSLLERLEQSANLKNELLQLRGVNGFTKAALSMQWVIDRVVQSGEDFSPDQFDVDATLLSDKLFEAFLSEPFGAPAAANAPVEVAAPSADSSSTDSSGSQLVEEEQQSVPSATIADNVTEPSVEAQTESVTEQVPLVTSAEEPLALTDLLDQTLLLGFQRFTEIVSKLADKTPPEREGVIAVLSMIAKSTAEVARAQGKAEIFNFFQSVLKFIQYVEASGLAQDPRVADIMRGVGDRLSQALVDRSNGVALLESINQTLQDSESSLKL